MRRIRLFLPVLAALALGACIAVAPTGIHRVTDGPDAGGAGGGLTLTGSTTSAPPENLPDSGPTDPHAVIGAVPSHGPFSGGQSVLVRGKGFTSKVRVWFGPNEAAASTLLAVDPTRVQVVAPPGAAGPVDVVVQNGDDTSTRRALPAGFLYDALYATPDSGPIPGGTVLEILGQGTAWDASSVARIDNKPCTTQAVVSAAHITCTAPPGSPGSKTVSVTTGADTTLVLDAYTYEDSTNGYKGGLSGAPLTGHLKVLVYDNYTGQPLEGALVIAGSDLATALITHADPTGVAVLSDPSLNAPRTVTIAAKCHSPITFVAEPVDTVTTYLDPLLTPACASSGDPPPVGGKPQSQGTIVGELVWPRVDEFKKGAWTNVPTPIGDSERWAAYVFVASADSTSPFYLPASSSAVLATSPGDQGYGFSLTTYPGNRSIYALAGIEDDSQGNPRFTAYAFGALNGVSVLPGQASDTVYIDMGKTLDQALTMNVAPPLPGPKGPDRLKATVAVRLGTDGYAILPGAQKSPFLPLTGAVTMVGLPALDGSLTGSVYVSSARAVTGNAGSAPLSVIGKQLSTSTAAPLSMEGFVGVPQLSVPAPNGGWDGRHLSFTFPGGTSGVDLSVLDIAAGAGVVNWTVAAPGGSQSVTLPDLSGFPDVALPPGPINISVTGGRIDGFDYQKLVYRQMRTGGMTAYALDSFDAHL